VNIFIKDMDFYLIYKQKIIKIIMEDKNLKMIKNEAIPTDEATLLRERFINEYSRKKGWNSKELSTTQMLEIVSQKEYKGLILG